MKVIYDSETDTVTVVLAETPIAESDEGKPGVVLDYDAAGNLVSLEILDASRRVSLPIRIEYQWVFPLETEQLMLSLVGAAQAAGLSHRPESAACYVRVLCRDARRCGHIDPRGLESGSIA